MSLDPPPVEPDNPFDDRHEDDLSPSRKRWASIVGFILAALFAGILEQGSQISGARQNPVVAAAFARASQNPQVLAAFGAPIDICWWSFVPHCPQCDHVNFSFDVNGPRASGTMFVLGDRSSLGPTLQRVYLRPFKGEVIDVVGSHLVKTAR